MDELKNNFSTETLIPKLGEMKGNQERERERRVRYLLVMELSSIGGEVEGAEAMAEAIEEEDLDAAQASDSRSLGRGQANQPSRARRPSSSETTSSSKP
jgi:hypothetical protein